MNDIGAFWEADFVAFAIGCSFSFEQALLDAGIGLRHLELGRNVAMYRTAIATRPSGRLAGPTVVSMRPLKAAEAIRAIQVTSRFPMTHGAPLHLGDPALIGIRDLARPDYGDPVPLAADEIRCSGPAGSRPRRYSPKPSRSCTSATRRGTCWSATDSTTNSERRRPSPDRG